MTCREKQNTPHTINRPISAAALVFPYRFIGGRAKASVLFAPSEHLICSKSKLANSTSTASRSLESLALGEIGGPSMDHPIYYGVCVSIMELEQWPVSDDHVPLQTGFPLP